MFIMTITPVRYPLSVRQGVNKFSSTYKELIEQVLQCCPELHAGDWSKETESSDAEEESVAEAIESGDQHSYYSNINRDDVDIRLFYWQGWLPSGQSIRVTVQPVTT